MNYLEFCCEVFPQRYKEIVVASFSDYGFESFVENEKGFSAYIQEKLFNNNTFESLDIFTNKEIKINYSVKNIPDQNWNAAWESDFEPVMIGNECYIRAPFHPELPGIRYEIIIGPENSFGTGHHETTQLMVQLLLEQNADGKEILDMGCGTAVLSILAKKMGAAKVLAIDNDEWAYNNAKENIKKNRITDIEVLLGDAGAIGGRQFDIILANINRNILLNDIPFYASALKKGGTLLLSGFYEDDISKLNGKATQFALKNERYVTMNSWCASVYIKE